MTDYPGLKDFLDSSPTAFHATESISDVLEKNGYNKLDETQKWELESGRGYYLIRDGRGVITLRFDAEEVGNRTTAGAASLFPDEIVERIVLSSGGGREELKSMARNTTLQMCFQSPEFLKRLKGQGFKCRN
ncbi:MAG: hypothetical protein DRZ90_02475 [Spirochaetes bacterium]|nr:MAG: hypothetical protein DRP60_08535 [Spirochaetota bacterium]RKX98553.1 MAG: hypothetical protein DRZ90_02475 [Spirochaetota bacterium]